MAAPPLANIDTDADLEVIINTAHSGVVAYDLPGSANAVLHWSSGRGGYLRNASLPAAVIDYDRSTFLPFLLKN